MVLGSISTNGQRADGLGTCFSQVGRIHTIHYPSVSLTFLYLAQNLQGVFWILFSSISPGRWKQASSQLLPFPCRWIPVDVFTSMIWNCSRVLLPFPADLPQVPPWCLWPKPGRRWSSLWIFKFMQIQYYGILGISFLFFLPLQVLHNTYPFISFLPRFPSILPAAPRYMASLKACWISQHPVRWGEMSECFYP